MSTSLSRQLAGIAATSTKQLDLRSQRQAHSQSLLFDPKVAATQDFDTIYDHCIAGFQELCRLDPRFVPFSSTIFSESAKGRERGQLTSTENAELDFVLERFLTLICKHLLLQPAQKAIEWLIRRFRVHESNTETLVLSFLIYHPLPIFSTLLSILPKNLPRSLKFLHPYRERLQPPSGDVLQHAVITNTAFFDTWTIYVLKSCKWRYHHEPMLSYWTIRIAAAIEAQLEPVKAGGAGAQRQREEDVTRKMTAILEKALVFDKIPSMIVGCYIIIEKLVLAASLSDVVVSTFMDAVVSAATEEIAEEAFMSLVSIAQKLRKRRLSPSVFRFAMKSNDMIGKLIKASSSNRVDSFAICLTMELIEQVSKSNDLTQRQECLQLLTSEILSDEALELAFRALLNPIEEAEKSGLQQNQHIQSLIELIQRIGDSISSPRAQNIFKRLGTSLGLIGGKEKEISTIEKPLANTIQPTIENGIILTEWTKLMPAQDVVPSSYLLDSDTSTFHEIAAAFSALLTTSGDLETFLASDSLKRDSAASSPTFISFFVRYWSSPFHRTFRARAIRCVTEALEKTQETFDLSQIFPYVLFALADTSEVIREAAVNLILGIYTSLQNAKESVQVSCDPPDIYGKPEVTSQISLPHLQTLLREFIVPSLEEYKMDHLAIGNSIRDCLNGLSPAGKEDAGEKMKKSSRTALLAFLADHAESTPILQVKITLLKLTSGCVKVGKLTRLDAFKPILESWIPSSEAQIQNACMKEKLDAEAFCRAIVQLITPSSATANKLLQRQATMVNSKTLLRAILDYVVTSWPLMEPSVRYWWALIFFDHGVLNNNDQLLDSAALDTLRSLQLSTEILEDFLKKVIMSDSESAITSPSIKRRKTNNGAVSVSTEAIEGDLKGRSSKIGILIELIRNAGFVASYTLLPGLFRVFQDLQRSKSTLQNDLTYVHWLLMNCLREIVERTSRTELKKLDHSDIRIDLIVDNLTHTMDPQTQYAALMLLSFLAKLEPELIIHSMMPVFTFMGNSILKQDDDHATFVVDQTINAVIPPLIESFKQHKGGALPGASGLILSFVAAFEHIIPSRRLDLFSALIDKLGPEDYLYVLFVVLEDRYGDEDSVHDFVSAMLLKCSPIIQFKTIENCLVLLSDSIQARPRMLKQIFVSDEGSPHGKRPMLLAELPIELLRVPQLAPKIVKVLRSNDPDAKIIRSCYADMVQNVLKLTLQDHGTEELSIPIAKIFGMLIGFFPVSESLRALDVILQQPNEALHLEVLRSFATTTNTAQSGDSESRDTCFKLLPTLVSVVERSQDPQLKKSGISCLNCIIKKYGKTNTSKTLEIAAFITGPTCLQSDDVDIQIAALDTIRTMVIVLGESIVPICPVIISNSLNYLSSAIGKEHWNIDLHNAVYSSLIVLFSTVPWMITGNELDRFLELSYKSASNSTDKSCDKIRVEGLDALARNCAPQTCLVALLRNWNKAVGTPGSASGEHLQILETVIRKHSKATIVSNVTTIVDHFMEIMNYRASRVSIDFQVYNDAEVLKVENTASSILIATIYKLNDTHFRPQFIRMSEWASRSKSKNESTRIRNLISWFSFLHKFFNTLQSIVTNYASYIIEPAIEILENNSRDDVEARLLWTNTISTLHATFEHDQDDFWKSPSRFSDICGVLIAQLDHGLLLDDDKTLVPCITAFAVAVESVEHRAEIHAKILQHFKSEDARVRRTMFTCEISLTEALGDEWISLFENSTTYPVMSEAFEDDNEEVENEVRKWKLQIEEMTGESLDTRLQ